MKNLRIDSGTKSKKSRGESSFLVCVLSVFLSLFFLTAGMVYWSGNQTFYMEMHKKNQVMQTMGISEKSLERVTKELISYLRGGKDQLSETINENGQRKNFYNLREKKHMKDVRELFYKMYTVFFISGAGAIVLGLYLWIRARAILIIKSFFYQGIVTFCGFLVIGFLIKMNFNQSFLQFHYLLFSNDLWILDPKTDRMIQMLPEAFFRSMGLVIVLTWIGEGGFVALAAFVFLKGKKHLGFKDSKRSEAL